MATWDYQVIQLTKDPTQGGNLRRVRDLGADEWEAFGVTEDTTGWWVFMKKPGGGEGGRARRRRANGAPRRRARAASRA